MLLPLLLYQITRRLQSAVCYVTLFAGHHPIATAMTHPDIMTTAQAADYLQLAEQTLEGWRRKRTGPPFIRIKRAVRYRKSDIDTWLEANKTESAV